MIHHDDGQARFLQGDVRDCLASLPDGCVQTCVTSPPYWGLRDYGVTGQLGLEPTPEAYVESMVAVFRDVRRVLRDDGTLWLNIGDSYALVGSANVAHTAQRKTVPTECKPKDLVGIPWMLAFALRADGWYLRSDIIWAKPNPMPESVTDRPTKAHEYLFLLSKKANYYYDADAIREAHKPESLARYEYGLNVSAPADGFVSAGAANPRAIGHSARLGDNINEIGRNKRTVWTIATAPYPEAHFATFPPDLVKPCILAGTSERGCCSECGAPWERVTDRESIIDPRPMTTGQMKRETLGEMARTTPQGRTAGTVAVSTTGWSPTCPHEAPVAPCVVLDPFLGSGTTAMVAKSLGRKAIGIDLSSTYLALAVRRCMQMGMAL